MATNKFVSLDKLSHFLTKLKEKIPTKTSQLTNDSNFVGDANYVHTDNNYTAAEKAKLQDIEDGANKTTVDDALSNTSTNPVQNKAVYAELANKVDKVSGKGLSTEDFTSALKEKLDGIESGANKYTLPPATANTRGGVKIGANITVAADGTISVTALEWSNINNKPTKLSEFTNDEEFITKTVSDLTNYYAKTSTYTKDEVNDLIGAIKTIQFQVVTTLPTTGQGNIIYLVSNGGTTPNIYDEYAWIESSKSFEKIGTTDVDLSGYWKTSDLEECTNDEIDALFTTW